MPFIKPKLFTKIKLNLKRKREIVSVFEARKMGGR